jgi:hypothetical protein
MRQLGARLPVPPPAETDVETPLNKHQAAASAAPTDAPRAEPYPVEVHRIDPQPVGSSPADSGPAARAPEPETDGAAGNPAARWAEFHEFRRLEPGRGGRLSLEPMRGQEDQLWIRPRVEREREHHFPFLTLAVPGIAAILAVGALLWSGSLRDRVYRQDAAMNALQEQNHKLADSVAQMSVEQKAASALNTSPDLANSPGTDVAQKPANDRLAGQQPGAAPSAQQSATPEAPTDQPGQATSQSASKGDAGSAPAAKGSSRAVENHQGVSTPPPVNQPGRPSQQQYGSRYRRPVQMGYAPEIVPPYPTNFKSDNVAPDAASSQPVPSAGTYHPAVPVTAPAPSAASSGRSVQTAQSTPSSQSYVPPVSVARPSTAQRSGPQPSLSRPPAASSDVEGGAPASASYNAAGDGSYASPLAENIEAVEGLQRHSPVPLHEFHVSEGRFTKVTSALGVSVRHPDQGHGTYALVINEDGKSYQLSGRVNSPLLFTDDSTHREYALVVLRIADRQVYGYLRPMH